MENTQKPVDNYVSQKQQCCQNTTVTVANTHKSVYASHIDIHARGNPRIDGNIVKGYN